MSDCEHPSGTVTRQEGGEWVTRCAGPCGAVLNRVNADTPVERN